MHSDIFGGCRPLWPDFAFCRQSDLCIPYAGLFHDFRIFAQTDACETIRHKNFKRLIIPAFLFSLLCWAYFIALMALKGVPFTFDGYVSKFLLGMIFYDRPNVTPPCGVIWFLQVLFISKILLDIVARYGDKAIFAVCVVCAAATWVWYTADINDMRYQFLLQRTCASFPFVALGYVAKEKQLFLKCSRIGWLPYLLLALYLAGVIYNGRVGIATWRFGYDVALYYLIAFTGCLCFFLFVNKIKFGGVVC